MNFGLKSVLRAINMLCILNLKYSVFQTFFPHKTYLETGFLGHTIEEMIGKIYRAIFWNRKRSYFPYVIVQNYQNIENFLFMLLCFRRMHHQEAIFPPVLMFRSPK